MLLYKQTYKFAHAFEYILCWLKFITRRQVVKI